MPAGITVPPATDFAGVILQTVAPPSAILFNYQDGGLLGEDGEGEKEVVVDPFGLGAMSVVERLRPVQHEQRQVERFW